MRILLIATNRHHQLMSRMEARPLPIGLAYVAGHLDPNRHTVKVLDLMFSDDYLADTESLVREFQPGPRRHLHPEPGQPELPGPSMGTAHQ